ncbi:hypothetical protein [Sphaerisporangium rubeum]|uniref:Uncharacterized protein n=1 Tax=Sphaerisporangium rubeum TaxID=321317 RepID=A0A7X0IAL6_9ACTN|nr:hypothetical protein [Sphaerisporangium rubeum]MBB6471676.1 hypothetical protein [Sphaerisporangium rubeum]
MTTLAHFLDGLRCEMCRALNLLWLDPVRGVVECRNCHQTALVAVDETTGEAR